MLYLLRRIIRRFTTKREPERALEIPPVKRKPEPEQEIEVLRHALGFSYYNKNGKWYARFRGTIWKLGDEDIKAISMGSFNTPKTKEIYASIHNALERAKRYSRKGKS